MQFNCDDKPLRRDLRNYSFTRPYFYIICIRLLQARGSTLEMGDLQSVYFGWLLSWYISHINTTWVVRITLQGDLKIGNVFQCGFFLHHTDLIAWGKNWATSSFISLHDKSCDFSYIYLWQSDYKIWDYKLIVVTTRKMPKKYLNQTNIFLPMAPVSWKVYGNGNKIG